MSKHFLVWITVCTLVLSPVSFSIKPSYTGEQRSEVALVVNEARAGAITFDPANLARMILEWFLKEAKNVAIEGLKQSLLKKLTDKQLSFVQNIGGLSRIVESWPRELQDAFNATFDRFLRELGVSNTLCQNIQIPTQLMLTRIRVGSTVPFKSRNYCTFQQVVGNVNNFINNFSSGGFIGYATLLQENPFEQMRLTLSEAVLTSLSSQEAKKTESVAASGFKSTKRCNLWVPWAPAGIDEDTPGWEEYCEPGGIQITTPGITTAGQTEGALDSQAKYTVNITSIISVVAQSYLSSLFNKVLTAGVNGLLGTGGAATPPTYNPGTLCQGSTGFGLLACYAAIGDCQSLKTSSGPTLTQLTTDTNALIGTLNSLVSCEKNACAAAAATGVVSPFCNTQTPSTMSQAQSFLTQIGQVSQSINSTQCSSNPAQASQQANNMFSQLSQLQGFDPVGLNTKAQGDLSQCQGTTPPVLPPTPVCGNGVIETGEECEGSNLNGQTCQNQGFASGNLSCNNACQFDKSACSGVFVPPGPTPECANGIDDDGDGLTDMNDPGCANSTDTSELNVPVGTPPPTGGTPACSNGLDDDGDGFIDWDGGSKGFAFADPACVGSTVTSELPFNGGGGTPPPSGTTACSNGVDDDGDGFIDWDGGSKGFAFADPACVGSTVTSELPFNGGGGTPPPSGGTPQCSDGIDNDNDFFYDTFDNECHSDFDRNNASSYVPSDTSEAF
jgi:hypothetical protein